MSDWPGSGVGMRTVYTGNVHAPCTSLACFCIWISPCPCSTPQARLPKAGLTFLETGHRPTCVHTSPWSGAASTDGNECNPVQSPGPRPSPCSITTHLITLRSFPSIPPCVCLPCAPTCTCRRTYAHIHACIHTWMHVYRHTHVCALVHICVHSHVRTCMYAHTVLHSCARTYTCAHTHACTDVCMHAGVHMHTQLCIVCVMHIHVHVRAVMYMHTCTYTHSCVHMCTRMYSCIHTCTPMHMCTCVHPIPGLLC